MLISINYMGPKFTDAYLHKITLNKGSHATNKNIDRNLQNVR